MAGVEVQGTTREGDTRDNEFELINLMSVLARCIRDED